MAGFESGTWGGRDPATRRRLAGPRRSPGWPAAGHAVCAERQTATGGCHTTAVPCHSESQRYEQARKHSLARVEDAGGAEGRLHRRGLAPARKGRDSLAGRFTRSATGKSAARVRARDDQAETFAAVRETIGPLIRPDRWIVAAGGRTVGALSHSRASDRAERQCPAARSHPRGAHAEPARGSSRKNRTISADASGPLPSVYEPLAWPPDQACPAPCKVQLSILACPSPSAWTVRV